MIKMSTCIHFWAPLVYSVIFFQLYGMFENFHDEVFRGWVGRRMDTNYKNNQSVRNPEGKYNKR